MINVEKLDSRLHNNATTWFSSDIGTPMDSNLSVISFMCFRYASIDILSFIYIQVLLLEKEFLSINVAFQNGYIVHPIGFSTEVIKYSCDVQTASAIAENAF